MDGLVLEEVMALQGILIKLLACEGFLSTMLLLVLVKVYSEPDTSPTCLTLIWFMPGVSSMVLSQI